MQAIFGSFIWSLLCTALTTTYTLSRIDGSFAYIIGFMPLASWIACFGIYVIDKDG